nr:MAG TPA: hypothetical protein [Caudoviricetes sp.]
MVNCVFKIQAKKYDCFLSLIFSFSCCASKYL